MKRIYIIFVLFLLMGFVPHAMAGGKKAGEEEKAKMSEEAPKEEAQTPAKESPSGGEKVIEEATNQKAVPSVSETQNEGVIIKKQETGTITGKIVDEKGNPVSGIVVQCLNESGVVVDQVVTDNEGTYKFVGIPKGKYRIVALYRPVTTSIEIKPKTRELKRPPIPTGLELKEVNYGIPGESFIKASWDRMENTSSYTCEIYRKKDKELIEKYSDIKQNYCVFGGLDENTDYMVRVYSKNRYGLSLSYALGYFKTTDRKPPPPYNLGYTYAKNNRIDLVWNVIKVKDLKGFVVQIKKENGAFLFYSEDGLTWNPKKAKVVESDKDRLSFTISGDYNGKPLVDNTIPYSFRVFAVDKSGNLSTPSEELKNVVLDDTVPPQPVYDVKYKLINGKYRVSWKSGDSDVVKYRVYYGVYKDRWDGVIVTKQNYYDFEVDAQKLPEGKLYIAVTAIDRAGNESGFRPVQKEASIEDHTAKADFILSPSNIYKDYSIAIKAIKPESTVKKQQKKKVKIKRPTPPKVYGYEYLKRKGFVVKSGEVATISGTLIVPEGVIIKVERGGRLNIKNAIIGSKSIWGGVRYLAGSFGTVENSTIKSVLRGLVILDGASVGTIRGLIVDGAKNEGVIVSNSEAKFVNIRISNCGLGIYSENSSVKLIDSKIVGNKKGAYLKGYRSKVSSSEISKNKDYGLRMAGNGEVISSIFSENMVGVFFEKSDGRIKFSGNRVEKSVIDGIVVDNSNVEIVHNEITGNGRYGIYSRNGANPYIIENNITGNKEYAVFGGGKVIRCYVAFNNSSPYIDETKIKGKIDGVFSSSSSDIIKQIFNVDYIENLSVSPVDFAGK